MPSIFTSLKDRASGAKVSRSSMMVGGATLACALGIGYIMQYGFALPQGGGSASLAPAEVEITAITPASSAASVGTFLPTAALRAPAEEAPTVTLAAAEEPEPEPMPQLAEPAPTVDCTMAMTAEAAAGALITLSVEAPCNPGERVTLHHMGLMFTEVLDEDGALRVTVPALAEQALFMAETASGAGASVLTTVPSLPFYDRVAVQWKGDSGLELHAREFAADYFTDGHVWADAAGDVGDAALGEGGFLMRLGNAETPDALRAEVYSFPSGTARREGEVLLSVEAEITEANCDQTVEAQTLDVRGATGLSTRALVLQMPGCDSLGDFLVLKNLIEDMKIAAR